MKDEKIQRILLEALRESGKLLKKALRERHTIERKSELSLVTETDKAAEQIIMNLIRRNFPDHAILTEESLAIGGKAPSRWVIDPLDGTTNFAHTYPVSCVSIAYEENGVVQLGGVFDPYRDELFFAERGQGATLNGQEIVVSQTASLRDSLLATGFPYDRREKIDDYLAIFKTFLLKVQDLRRAGAAALDLCYVACGRFDGYWELQLQPWDKAAAALILEEAGGSISDFSGNPLTLEGPQNLATNGFIHREMLETLKPFQNLCK